MHTWKTGRTVGDLTIEKEIKSVNVGNAACEPNNITPCMAKDEIYVSVDDLNANRR